MTGVDVGSMLVIPFGQRRLLGVVVGMSETSEVPAERLVEPLKALESGVPAELVRLGLWVAEGYCSTPARGLSLVLPPGAGTGASRSIGPRRGLVASVGDGGWAAARDAAADPRPPHRRHQRDGMRAMGGGGGGCGRGSGGRPRPARRGSPARGAERAGRRFAAGGRAHPGDGGGARDRAGTRDARAGGDRAGGAALAARPVRGGGAGRRR